MSLIFWGKVYITMSKKRLSWQEKKIDLAIDITLALLFSIGFIDLFFDIPKIIYLQNLLKTALTGG
jgi:hypothetical protein